MSHDTAVSTKPRHGGTVTLVPDRPLDSAPSTETDPDEGAAGSLASIGDIAMAGATSGYAHLASSGPPTVGRLTTFARSAAQALARPPMWPRRFGHWHRVPRSARRGVPHGVRVTAVRLRPEEFVSLAAEGGHGVPAAEVVYAVRGRTHVIDTLAPSEGAGGALRAVRALATDRARVLAGGQGRQLVNTGTETAVVVRVSAV
ncbi:hypothetical protein [Salinactinospora qingdaonensis]|uniref:Uncharacterized protein n=1 Tax=Salinactinospora qingdaonensis TaxID=702744 RepID=A0ABP7G5E3_9ACTN